MTSALAELLFELLNFGLLAGGLGWLLFAPVRKALAAESARHGEALASLAAREDKLGHESDALASEQADFRRAMVERGRAAELSATELLATQRSSADAALKAEQANWAAERSAREDAALARLEGAAAEVAAGAVRGLLERCQGPDLDLALARSALLALGAAPASPARVELASPASADLRLLLEQALPAGVDLHCTPSLVAGLRLVTPTGVVDASASGIASQARDAVRAELAAGHDV